MYVLYIQFTKENKCILNFALALALARRNKTWSAWGGEDSLQCFRVYKRACRGFYFLGGGAEDCAQSATKNFPGGALGIGSRREGLPFPFFNFYTV